MACELGNLELSYSFGPNSAGGHSDITNPCLKSLGLATVSVYGYDRTLYGWRTGTDRPVHIPYTEHQVALTVALTAVWRSLWWYGITIKINAHKCAASGLHYCGSVSRVAISICSRCSRCLTIHYCPNYLGLQACTESTYCVAVTWEDSLNSDGGSFKERAYSAVCIANKHKKKLTELK